jgi:hypothetical protein
MGWEEVFRRTARLWRTRAPTSAQPPKLALTMELPMNDNIADLSFYRLLSMYRQAAHGTSVRDPDAANRSHDTMHACYKILRQTEEGRRGIVSLMDDVSPHVRLWAAAHSLQWIPDRARACLEALRESGGPGAFDAEITLEEFSKGSLRFDYD